MDVSVTISAFSIVNGITYYFSDIGNGCARLDAIRAAGSLEISVLDIPGKVSIGNAEYVVTQIGTQFTGSSFSSVDTSKIKIVRIADSVESIGAFAFYNLPNLKSVEFASNSNLKEIGSYAFGMSGHIYSPEEEQGSSQPGEGAAISVDFPADQAVTEQEIPLGEECEVRVSMKCADFGGTPATVYFALYDAGRQFLPGKNTMQDSAMAACLTSTVPQETGGVSTFTVTVGAGYYDAYHQDGYAIGLFVYDAGGVCLNGAVSLFLVPVEAQSQPDQNETNVDDLPNYFQIGLPDTVVILGPHSLDRAAKVVISENSRLQTIGDGALQGLHFPLYIPRDVSSIGSDSINRSVELTISADNPYYRIDSNGNLTNIEGSTLIMYFGTETEYTIPDSISFLSAGAFKGNETVTRLILDRNILCDGFVFEDSALEEVVIGPVVTEIPDYLFGKSKVVHVIIPSNVREIGTKAFYNTSLEDVVFSDDSEILKIGSYAFSSNPGLSTVSFGSSCEGYSCTIGIGSFFYCNNLSKVEVDEGFNLTQIGAGAFAKYIDNNVQVRATAFGTDNGIRIPASVAVIGIGAFSATSSKTSSTGLGGDELTSEAFGVRQDASSMTLSFAPGSVVSSIASKAFSGLWGLSRIDMSECATLVSLEAETLKDVHCGDIVLPPNLQYLQDRALANTSGDLPYEEYIIPASIEYVGQYALDGLSKSLVFGESSKVAEVGKIIGGSNLFVAQDTVVDLRNCGILQLINASVGNYYLPAGVYRIASPINILNADEVIYSVDSGAMQITSAIKAINSDVLRGLDSIECQTNDSFSFDGSALLYSSGDGVSLIAVISGVSDYTIPSDSSIASIRDGALAGSSIRVLRIEKSIQLGSAILEGCSSVERIAILSQEMGMRQDSFVGMSSDPEILVYDGMDESVKAYLRNAGDLYNGALYGSRAVFLPERSGSIMMSYSECEVVDGVFSAKASLTGGYQIFDMAVEAAGYAVTLTDGGFSFDLTSDETVVHIIPRDRSGDVAVVFDGNGGYSDGLTSVSLFIASGLSIVDSEIPVFKKDCADFGFWTLDGSGEYDFESPVTGPMTLQAVWMTRAPTVSVSTTAGLVYCGSEVVSDIAMLPGDVLELTLVPFAGYEPIFWDCSYGGEHRYSDASQPLVLAGIDSDVEVTVTYRFYSLSTELIPVVNTGMPSAEELMSIVQVSRLGGEVDTTGMVWSGTDSVPLIVDGRIYFRAGPWLYMAESDTGYVLKSVRSANNTDFYHYIGYGDGVIIDGLAKKAYDLDLNQLYTMTEALTSVSYDSGYFYTILGGSVYRFVAEDEDASTYSEIKDMELVGKVSGVYSSYGATKAIFKDGFMYCVYASGADRGVIALDIETGESSVCVMPGLKSMYLDDGWMSEYEGTLFLTAYSTGLFGDKACNKYSMVGFVNYDGISFDVDNIGYYEFSPNVNAASEFVVKDDRAYVLVGGELYVFDIERSGDSIVSLVNERSIQATFSHGSIVIDDSRSEPSNQNTVYVYLIPYSPTSDEGLDVITVSDSGISRTITSEVNKTWCSQAVRSDVEGRMVWYNDSGHIFTYTTPEKNPYYFFLDDGSQAGWHVAYGKNAYEAAKSLGSQLLVIDGNAEVSRMFGKVVSESSITVVHAPANTVMQYEWAAVDSFSNRSYDTDHYWIITANAAAVSEGDVLSYIDGEDVSECSFAENIGDRSLLGLRMAPGTDVSTVRFYEGGAEIADSAMIGVIGSEVPGSFPGVYREGYMPVWTDAGGNAAESLSGTSFAEGGTEYHLSWAEIPTYEVSNIEAGAAPGTVSLSFDVLTIDTDPLRVSVMLGFEDGTFASTESTVAAADGAASFSWSARAPGIPVSMVLEVQKSGVLLYQSFDNTFEGVSYAYEVGTVMVIDGLVYEIASMDPEAVTLTGYDVAPEGALTIPGTLEVGGHAFGVTVGKKAFARCYGLTSVTIGADIGPYAFYGCSALKVVRISDGAASIGKSAFSSCARISYVVIADSVEEIGENAFYKCSFYSGEEEIKPTADSLAGHKFTGSRTHLEVYVPKEGGTFSAGGLKYRIVSSGEEKSVSLKGFASEASADLAVPETVRYLGFDWQVVSVADKAFYGCEALTSVDLGSVFSVGYKSFAGCGSLESVVFGAVSFLGDYSFANCASLSALDLSGVSEMGASAFSGCSGLTSVAFSESLSSVGKNAFFRNLFYDGDAGVPRTADGLAGKTFEGMGGKLFLVD